MNNPLMLITGELVPITPLEDVTQLLVPLCGHTAETSLKKRMPVAKGTVLATHADASIPDVHAPLDGVIQDISANCIVLSCTTEAQEEIRKAVASAQEAPAAPQTDAESAEEAETANTKKTAAPVSCFPPTPVDFTQIPKESLRTQLKKLGITLPNILDSTTKLIINGLHPEPGIQFTDSLLQHHSAALEAGLALLNQLVTPETIFLALPENCTISLPGATPATIKAEYPNSLPPLLIKAVYGQENAPDTAVISLSALFSLGQVAQTGLPLSTALITVQGANLLVPIGTPVSELLSSQGIQTEDDGIIVLGGLMRGRALAYTNRGIAHEGALWYLPKGSKAPYGDNPCINCGFCVKVCPMRLRPNKLSRYAEFQRYASATNEAIDVCIECGLCGFVCPAYRPMQQHLGMTKINLGLPSLQNNTPYAL